MERMSIWPNPVTMDEIRPPVMEDGGKFRFIRHGDDVEVARCIHVGETLILPECVGGSRVTGLGAGAASNCEEMTCAMLPRYVRRIGDYAFFQCVKLEDVRLPEGLRVIGEYAFAGCAGLRTLYVPPTVTAISDTAFEGIDDLTLTGTEGSAGHRYALKHGLFFMTAGGPNAA